jgi:rhodanese-related sulfurtransferase
MTASQVHCTGAEEATPRQVSNWLRAGEAVLIDVREPDEHARERIAGARLLPLSRFDPQLALTHAKPGQRLVMHCRGGHRSAEAARMAASLSDSGIKVSSMSGGLEAWKKAHLPIEVNAKACPISVMRQVQMVIGIGVITGCVLAWFVHPAFIGIPTFFGLGLTFAGASGTCGMARLLGMMPWNKFGDVGGSCSSGQCN